MDTSKKFLIGTSGWIYKHWLGKFYPQDLPQKKWFSYYSEKFSCVEINATYYRSFKETTYENWYTNSPPHFKYVLKAHRLIVHRKDLEKDQVLRFNNSANLLKEKLGLILLQFPAKMLYDLKHLEEVLSLFPDRKKLAVEFRNPKWFNKDTKKLLTKLKVTFVTADSPETDLLDWVTPDYGYIRLHGHNNWYQDCYSKKELEKIAKIAKKMTNKGARKIYIFFNNDYLAYAPQNALELAEILN